MSPMACLKPTWTINTRGAQKVGVLITVIQTQTSTFNLAQTFKYLYILT